MMRQNELYESPRRPIAMEILSTVSMVMNFVVMAVVTFEAVARICSFLKTWKPVPKSRRMGFYHESNKGSR